MANRSEDPKLRDRDFSLKYMMNKNYEYKAKSVLEPMEVIQEEQPVVKKKKKNKKNKEE